MYYIYIISLIIFIFLIALLHTINTKRVKEYFTEKDYNTVTRETLSNNSCVKLLVEKNLFDDDNTKINNDRKNILTDMDIARYPESDLRGIIYRAKDACVLRKDAINTYYNNDGVNLIDHRCRLRGVNVDNVPITYKMKKPDIATVPTEGCEIDWSGMTKADVNNVLDKFYQLKMYPFLYERKNTKKALTDLQEINVDLLQQNTLLTEKIAELSKHARGGLDNFIKDSIQISCRDDQTEWMNIVDDNNKNINSFKTLEKHAVKCRPGEVISQFKYEQSGSQDRIKFKCCKVDTAPISNKIKENKDTVLQEGPKNAAGDFGDIILMTNTGVQCAGNPNNKKFLTAFQMRSIANGSEIGGKQVIDPNRYESRTDYLCTNFETSGIPNKKIQTRCTKYRTPPTEPTNVSVLSQHNILCNISKNEGLVDYKVVNDGTNIYYEYTCCEPSLTDSIEALK